MILPIYIEQQPVLRQKVEPITEITPEIIQLATDMRETMHNAKGLGLAAPQVGKSVALIVLELQADEPGDDYIPYMALLNPRITWKSTHKVPYSEACLSLPGIEGVVHRPDRIRVKARDLEGKEVEIRADGILARALQHEIDHLHGILFTDYVPKKQLVSRKLVKYPQV